MYDRLGHGAENGTWRNFFLMGALELRGGAQSVLLDTGGGEMAMALTVQQLVDSIAVRIDGPRAWDEDLVVDLRMTDEQRRYRLTLHNGALTQRSAPDSAPVRTPAQLTLSLTKPQLLGVLAGKGLDGVGQDGDPQVLGRLFGLLSDLPKDFPIVTP